MNLKKKIARAYDEIHPLKTKLPENKKPFYRKPLFLIPVCGLVAVAALSGTVAGLLIGNADPLRNADLLLNLPKSDKPVGCDVSESFAENSLSLLQNHLTEAKGNTVLSPVGFSLCGSGYALASTTSDAMLERLGLVPEQAKDELKNIMETLNWSSKKDGADSRISSLILYQIIDDSDQLSFNEEYRDYLLDSYMSSLRSNSENYKKEAQSVINEAMGHEMPMPDPTVSSPGAAAWSALYLKDSAKLSKNHRFVFHAESGDKTVKGNSFGGIQSLYVGEDYKIYSQEIEYTSLVFILPNEGTPLESIDLVQAYRHYREDSTVYFIDEGSVPYFNIKTDADLTSEYLALAQGAGCMDRLIEGTENMFRSECLQSSTFSFTENGVEGAAVTVMVEASSPDPQYIPHETFVCDRPFYALSTYSGLPLFAMKVCDPTL